MDNAADLPGAADTVYGLLPGAPWMLTDFTFTGHGNTSAMWIPGPDGTMQIPGFEETALPL